MKIKQTYTYRVMRVTDHGGHRKEMGCFLSMERAEHCLAGLKARHKSEWPRFGFHIEKYPLEYIAKDEAISIEGHPTKGKRAQP